VGINQPCRSIPTGEELPDYVPPLFMGRFLTGLLFSLPHLLRSVMINHYAEGDIAV